MNVDNFDPNDYEFTREVTKTTIWSFYEVEHKHSKKLFNIFEVLLDFPNEGSKYRHNCECLKRLQKIIHPNLPYFVAYSDKNLSGQNYPCYLMEHNDVQSLYDVISNDLILSDKSAQYYIIYQISHCLRYLHSKYILHNRLSINSIVIDNNFDIYIIDFFVPRCDLENQKDLGLCARYVMPNLINDKKHPYSSDIFSFGLLMFAILYNKEPYEEFESIQKISSAISQMIRPKFPPKMEIVNRIKSIMNSCINQSWQINFEVIMEKFQNYFPLGSLICNEQGIKYMVFDELNSIGHNNYIICQPQKICSTPKGDIAIRVSDKCNANDIIRIISLYYDINENLHIQVGDNIIKYGKVNLHDVNKFCLIVNNSDDSDDDGCFNIMMKASAGKKFNIKVRITDTVYDLKCKYLDLTGEPVELARLIFCGKQLEDEKTLISYGIQEDCAINHVTRMLG